MSRSKWKMPYIDYNLNKEIQNSSKNQIKVFSRSSIILPEYIDKNFLIYNGIRFFKIKISKDMIGHKFGEYSTTRKCPIIGKKKKINNGTKS